MAVVTPDSHRFVQFAAPVAALDERGGEELIDRAVVGVRIGSFGAKCVSIVLVGSWFDVVDEKHNAYRVPVTNVRSARR